MPASLLMKAVSVAHSSLYRWSGGRVGGRLGSLPVLLLTTAGRRTGKPRTIPLVYLRDGDDLVIVGSNAGHDWHPAWFWNLQADGRATVRIDGARERRIGTIATAEERHRLWPEVVGLWPGYARYQRETRRPIPLVILRRNDEASDEP